ncbi:MAG: hypothetical protein GKC10_07700 [Methanosarcinales archaeon]|nr:hypothetical protein [Methanosarcinales archaeon]
MANVLDMVTLYGVSLWKYHGSLVFTSFLLLVAGMFMARYRPGRWWLRAHRALGAAGVAFGLLGVTAAAYMVESSTGEHLAVPHAYLGTLVVVLLLVTPSLGLAQFRFRSRAARIRPLHRWSGRTTLALMAANILAGLTLLSQILK